MASRAEKKAARKAINSAKRGAKRVRLDKLISKVLGGTNPLIPEGFAAEAGAAVGAEAPNIGRLASMKNALTGPVSGGTAAGLGGGLAFMLAEMLGQTALSERGLDIGADLQSEQLGIQSEAATPENFMIQALLPSSEQQKQQAMQALMQQLTGGNMPRQLARGEVLT